MAGLACLVIGQAGCFPWHRPGSRGFDGAGHTWTTSENQGRVLKLINTDDESVIWEIEIPAGKWLITRFSDGASEPDDSITEAELRYVIVDAGPGGIGNPWFFTSLDNKVSVPPVDGSTDMIMDAPEDTKKSTILETKPANESLQPIRPADSSGSN
jgi:hypothetical protein